MISETSSFIGKALTIVALLHGFSNALAEELYQWKDVDGTITYSTTPPPANITSDYQEISKKLSASTLTPSAPNASVPNTAVILAPEKPIAKNESRLERLVRLSPEPLPVVKPIAQETILQPVNQDKVRKKRKCRDLENRVGALEARLSTVSSTKELNDSMLLLTRYQNSFDQHCQ